MSKQSPYLAALLTCVSWSFGCDAEELGAAPPQLPAAAPAPCDLSAQAYRIDSLVLPDTVTAALDVSLDLDGDDAGRLDNVAGSVYATLAGQYEGRLEQLAASVAAALDDGLVRWVLVVETCDAGDDYARVSLHRASDLDGDGALRLLPYGYVPAVGARRGDIILAREGTASAPLSVLFDVLGTRRDVTWVDGYAFAVDLDDGRADGSIAGRLGLGLDERAFPVAAVPLADFYTELLATGGSELAFEMDLDEDGAISPDELMANQLMSTLAAPDLDLAADYGGATVYWPHHDGIRDSTSIGLGFTAVPVALD